jgi:hypothetical protein
MDTVSLAESYAAERLAEAIANPANVAASATKTPGEIEGAYQAYREREYKSAMRLLSNAIARDFRGLSSALSASNPNWRKLFCDFAQVDSLPRTQSGLRDFLRSWIGPEEVDRQTAELERIRAEDERIRDEKIAERKRADCLKNAYRFCFSESGGIVETTTFGRVLDYVANLSPSWGLSKRGAFPIIRIYYGADKHMEFRKSEEIKEIKARFPERSAVTA